MENGSKSRIFARAEENKFTLTVPCTRATGLTTKRMEREGRSAAMERYIQVNGKTIFITDTAYYVMGQVAVHTMANGRKVSSMVWVMKPGRMAQVIKDCIVRLASMAKVSTFGGTRTRTEETL